MCLASGSAGRGQVRLVTTRPPYTAGFATFTSHRNHHMCRSGEAYHDTIHLAELAPTSRLASNAIFDIFFSASKHPPRNAARPVVPSPPRRMEDDRGLYRGTGLSVSPLVLSAALTPRLRHWFEHLAGTAGRAEHFVEHQEAGRFVRSLGQTTRPPNQGTVHRVGHGPRQRRQLGTDLPSPSSSHSFCLLQPLLVL